ncbi:MAG: VWA domain-containing protein [Bacteroidales bacterium]
MIKFEHPTYLYLLILIPVFIGLHIAWVYWKRRVLKQFGDMELVSKLTPAASKRRPATKFIFMLIAYAFLVIAIANPQSGSKLEQARKRGIDIMIALDVSNSMLAEDITPNRLLNAKQSISKIINRLDGDRIGIVIFAGKAFLQLPLTTDYGAARLFLENIDTRSVGVQGTAIGEALTICDNSFDDKTKHSKAILLITDGEDHEGDAIQVAKTISAKGIKIFTIGMGSPEGAPIPNLDKYGNSQGYKKDRANNIVVSKLDSKLLEELAETGNGAYVRASNSRGWFNAIIKDLDNIQKQDLEVKNFSDYEDRFQYFLAIAIIFLIIELFILERRNKWSDKISLFD